MRAYFSYTLELDEGETAESLAERCKVMDCPCEDMLNTYGRCPLGSLEVTGLCRLTSVGEWEATLQQELHEADI